MTREEYCAALREVADFLEAHPDVPAYGEEYGSVSLTQPIWTAEDLAKVARALGQADKHFDSHHAEVAREIGPFRLGAYGSREQVCTRKVVGTEIVEIDVEVTPAVTEKETIERDIVEWECEPILSRADG